MRPGIIAFVVFAFIGMTLVDGWVQGQSGMLATPLTGSVSSNTIVIPADTSGFPAATVGNPQLIFVDKEQIAYISMTPTQFNVATNGRGVNNTTASSHTAQTMIYNIESNMVNQTAGFNVISANTNAGAANIAWNTLGYFTNAIPNMLTWNFSYMQGPAQYVALFLKALSSAVVIGIGMMFVYALWGILKP